MQGRKVEFKSTFDLLYGQSKVKIEKAKICLRFIIVYDILIVLVIANSVVSILYTVMVDSAISIRTRNIQLREDF